MASPNCIKASQSACKSWSTHRTEVWRQASLPHQCHGLIWDMKKAATRPPLDPLFKDNLLGRSVNCKYKQNVMICKTSKSHIELKIAQRQRIRCLLCLLSIVQNVLQHCLAKISKAFPEKNIVCHSLTCHSALMAHVQFCRLPMMLCSNAAEPHQGC